MQEVLTFGAKTRGSIRHHAFSLGSADFPAQICFPGFAEFAVPALGGAEEKEDEMRLGILHGRRREVSRLTTAQQRCLPLSQM